MPGERRISPENGRKYRPAAAMRHQGSSDWSATAVVDRRQENEKNADLAAGVSMHDRLLQIQSATSGLLRG